MKSANWLALIGGLIIVLYALDLKIRVPIRAYEAIDNKEMILKNQLEIVGQIENDTLHSIVSDIEELADMARRGWKRKDHESYFLLGVGGIVTLLALIFRRRKAEPGAGLNSESLRSSP